MSVHDHSPVGHAALPRLDVGRRLLLRVLNRIDRGRLSVQLPSGARLDRRGPMPGPEAAIVLRNWRAARRIVADGDLGFAEGYIAGDWTTPDLVALIELFALNHDAVRSARGSWLSRGLGRVWHIAHANTKRGSRRNIRFHYDLGNAFYEAWLDRGMQYSAALYDGADDLESAQQAKLDRIAQLLDLTGGERVLEVGCGWGAVAERLASRHGCHVTGLTLSSEQLAYARRRIEDGGLSSTCDLRFQDYRDCGGTFDRTVSIEMIEAVGEKYWRDYFDLLRARLVPGGTAVIQAITIDDARFERYRGRTDFIQRYVFPGGMLPTEETIRREMARAGLELVCVENFGASYAQTLAEWRHRFLAAWPMIAHMGFDTRFRQTWEYYLSYCEGGFRAGVLDVSLFAARRK